MTHVATCKYAGTLRESSLQDDCCCLPVASGMTPERELDLILLEPERESVVAFLASYPLSPLTYRYLAAESGGKWFLAGQIRTMSWAELIRWFGFKQANILTVRQATSWKML